MESVLIFATIISPIVLAIIELLKHTVNVKKNLIPLASLVIGLLVGAISYPFTDLELVLRFWAGSFAGLAATGLFELGNKREGTTKGDVK
jgi:hypothetical protein